MPETKPEHHPVSFREAGKTKEQVSTPKVAGGKPARNPRKKRTQKPG